MLGGNEWDLSDQTIELSDNEDTQRVTEKSEEPDHSPRKYQRDLNLSEYDSVDEESVWSEDEDDEREKALIEQREERQQRFRELERYEMKEKYSPSVILKLQHLFDHFAKFENPLLFILNSSKVLKGALLPRLIEGNPWEAKKDSREFAELVDFVKKTFDWIYPQDTHLQITEKWSSLFIESFTNSELFDLRNVDVREAFNIFKEEIRETLAHYQRNLEIKDVVTLILYKQQLIKLKEKGESPKEYHFLGLNTSLLGNSFVNFIGQLILVKQQESAEAIHNFFYLINKWIKTRREDEELEEPIKQRMNKNILKAFFYGMQFNTGIFEKQVDKNPKKLICEMSLLKVLLEESFDREIFSKPFNPTLYRNNRQHEHKANVELILRNIDFGLFPRKSKTDKYATTKTPRSYRVPIEPFKTLLTLEKIDEILGDQKDAQLTIVVKDDLSASAEELFLRMKTLHFGGKTLIVDSLYSELGEEKTKKKKDNAKGKVKKKDNEDRKDPADKRDPEDGGWPRRFSFRRHK